MSYNITAPLLTSPGASFVTYAPVALDEIYISKTDTGGTNNPARFVIDMGNVNLLGSSFRTCGQDLSCPLPVVEKLPVPLKQDDKIYTYKMVVGHHRHAGAKQAGLETLVFAVYKFESDEARFRFQLVENNHAPAKAATCDDIANALTIAVHKGYIQNNEEDMRKYTNLMNKIHGNTINKAISKAIRQTGGFQDYHIYTKEDIEDWFANNDYAFGGKKDSKRGKVGWGVKEGFVYEYLMNAMRKYSTESLESYFICHTKAPTEKNSLDERRNAMLSEFRKLETAIEKVMEFKKEHKRFPWSIEGFLPQDNIKQERELVVL